MSGTVSYASAARSAAKESKDVPSTPSGATTPSTSIKEGESSASISKATSPVSESETDFAAATSFTPAPISSEAEVSIDVPTSQETETDSANEISSINKDKLSLTPAPLPKVNAWGVKSAPAAALPLEPSFTTIVEPTPLSNTAQTSDAAAQSQASLNPVHWPKPDEGTPGTDKKDRTSGPPAPAPAKARLGKEKWVPMAYTPVTSKPRSNKSSRSGNSSKANHNSASATGSPPSQGNGSAAAGGKGRGQKNFNAKSGAQSKKNDSGKTANKAQPSQRTASVSSATSNPGKAEAPKVKPAPNSAPIAPSAKGPGPKKSRSANGTTSAETSEGANNTLTHNSNGFHHNNHHNNHHTNGGHHHNHNQRAANGAGNGTFPQQFVPFNNALRSSQMGHFNGSKYYVPDYGMYNQMYSPQSQYDMTLGSITYQIEYYFSLENLLKDMFLRKQMNSNGWIPLSLLASFNRLNSLTGGDFNLFLEACKWAPSVEVSGDKIRARNWELWVLPPAERQDAGRDEESPVTPKLIFNPADAAPFVPKAEGSTQ